MSPMVLNPLSGVYSWKDTEPEPFEPTPAPPRAQDMTGFKFNPMSGVWSIDYDAKAPAPEMVEVSEAGVAAWRKALATDVLETLILASTLQLPTDITVKWFRPETDVAREMREAGRGLKLRTPLPDLHDGHLGGCNGNDHATLWLRADTELLDLAEATGHEAFHASTFDKALAGEDVDLDDEAAALAFGQEIRRMVEQIEADVDVQVAALKASPPRPTSSPPLERKAAPFYGVCYTCGDRRIVIPGRHICPSAT